MSSGRDPEVVVVTTAALSHSADIALRQRRYVITQMVRVVCVLLATTLPVAPVWKLGLIVGAVALPWFGVVAANAGPTVQRRRRTAIVERQVASPERIAVEPGRVVDMDTESDGDAR